MTTPEKEEFKRLKEELVSKDEQLGKLKDFSTNMNNKLVKSQNELAIEKEKIEELEKKAATPVKDLNVETKLRKIRDDCIEALRKNNIELNELKQENLEIKKDVINLEKRLHEKEEATEGCLGTHVQTYAQTCVSS